MARLTPTTSGIIKSKAMLHGAKWQQAFFISAAINIILIVVIYGQ